MPLSAQQAPIRNLVAFKEYAKARGCTILESLPEDRPAPGVHAKDSWHYHTEKFKGVVQSTAADINYGPSGTSSAERAMLTHLVTVAQSMGLGVVYALYGTAGAAAAHQTHLHVDVGSWTNLGKNIAGRHATPGDLCVWDTQKALHGPRDNLSGPDTRKRINALREASARGGNDFPYGVRFAEVVVGVKPDNRWNSTDRAAHNVTVKELKRVWKAYGIFKGTVDTTWDIEMDKALSRYKVRYE